MTPHSWDKQWAWDPVRVSMDCLNLQTHQPHLATCLIETMDRRIKEDWIKTLSTWDLSQTSTSSTPRTKHLLLRWVSRQPLDPNLKVFTTGGTIQMTRRCKTSKMLCLWSTPRRSTTTTSQSTPLTYWPSRLWTMLKLTKVVVTLGLGIATASRSTCTVVTNLTTRKQLVWTSTWTKERVPTMRGSPSITDSKAKMFSNLSWLHFWIRLSI